MNPYAIPPLITGIILALIGFFVFLKNTKSPVNIIFCLFCYSMVWWLAGYVLMYLSHDDLHALAWARFGFIGIIFIPIFAYHFITVFLNIKLKRAILLCLYGLTLPSLIFSQSNLIYKSITTHFWGYYPVAGKYYFAFLTMFATLFSYGVWLLFKGLQNKTIPSLKKQQIRYVLLAFGIGTIGVVDYLIKYPIFNIYPFGYICALLFISLIAYAIVRHRLLDIEIFIKKTLVFASLFTIVFGVFVGITLLMQELIAGGRLLAVGISSLIIIFMVRPLEDILARLTDRYLFQREYDRQQLLKEVSQGIIGKIELEDLKSFISSVLLEKMKLENIAIVVEDNILFNWHKENRMPISYDTIDRSYKEKKDAKAEVKVRMKELKASLSIPVFLKNEIFWLLLFGDKKSGRIYSTEDINMLEALSHEISIAIENAVNFQELKLSQMELLRQENLKFVSVLVKGLAHEIFNPLMPLMHKIEDLEGEDLIKIYEVYEKNKSKLDKDDETKFRSSLLSLRESTKSLKTNASHIHLIIDTLSKLEKGDEKTIGPLDIKSFFKEVVTLFGLEIEPNLQRGVAINQDIAQNLPPVKANPTLLKQIFINLYKNSCYAMKNSSTKVININCATSDANQNEVKIEFSDTGSGISPNVHSKIFTYGFTTKGSKGSGIGLNQCRAIIERFGGTIIFESEENKGTRVTIKVPIWEEEVKNVA